MLKELLKKIRDAIFRDRELRAIVSVLSEDFDRLTLRVELQEARYYVDDLTTEGVLDAAIEDMRNNDESLAGDLSMVMHVLSDPVNGHSLMKNALAIAAGEIEEDRALNIAQAIEILVTEYRAKLDSWTNFNMSDAACLIEMDIERGTCHNLES